MQVLRNLLIGAVLATAACASPGQRDLNDIARREQDRVEVDTVQAAILYGEQYSRHYLREGFGVRSRRTTIDLVLLAANTFVTAAAGLEAHPDTIFAGALVASTVHNLDPIVNAGGVDAWQAAYATNLCVLQVARAANSDQLLQDYRLLQAVVASEPADVDGLVADAGRTLSRHRGAALTLQAAMDRAFGTYVRQTTPDLIAVNSAAQQVIEQRTTSVTVANNDESVANLGEGPFPAETRAAIARMTDAIAIVDADTPKCFPASEG